MAPYTVAKCDERVVVILAKTEAFYGHIVYSLRNQEGDAVAVRRVRLEVERERKTLREAIRMLSAPSSFPSHPLPESPQ